MRRLFALIAAVALGLLVVLRAIDPWPVQAAREGYFDLLQRLAPRPALDLPVRVVDIDEGSLAALGQWPWPRSVMAELTDRLTALGAAVVVFDVLFSEPDRLSPSRIVSGPGSATDMPPDLRAALSRRDFDADFAAALGRGVPVLGIARATGGVAPSQARAGFVEIGPDPTARFHRLAAVTPIVPMLDAAALGTGVINVSPDGLDGTVRRVPLVWQSEAGPIPGLAVEALRVAIGESTIILSGLVDAPGLAGLRLGDLDIPTNDRGELRVRYRPFDPAMFVPAHHVLDAAMAEAVAPSIDGHIVFVGTSAAGLLDIRETPLGESVPGVSIHAQIVEQVLTGDHLIRSDAIAGAEILALVATGLVVSSVLAFGGALTSIAAGGLAGAALIGFSWVMFRQSGLLFDVTYPVFAGFTAFSLLAMFQYAVSDRDRRRIRRSFAKYVSEEVLGEIEATGHSLELGGEIRDVTVLFTDIRDFTPLSETMDARDLVSFLNRLFTDLTGQILAGRGTIDKYIGDAIMAFWNAPIELDDHPARACDAVLAMQAALDRFNADRQAEGAAGVDVLFGLAAGPACVGNIGSEARYNYSVVGETVNRAARIEAACRSVGASCLVDAAVARAAPAHAMLFAGSLDLKGVSGRTDAYALLGGPELGASAGFVALREAHAAVIGDLAAGRDAAAGIARARQSARAAGCRLDDLYDRITARRADFVS